MSKSPLASGGSRLAQLPLAGVANVAFLTLLLAGCVPAKGGDTDTGGVIDTSDDGQDSDTVTDTGSAPEPTITVYAYTRIRELWAESSAGGLLPALSSMNDGDIHVFGLEPGTWWIVALSDDESSCLRSQDYALELGDEEYVVVETLPGAWDSKKRTCE